MRTDQLSFSIEQPVIWIVSTSPQLVLQTHFFKVPQQIYSPPLVMIFKKLRGTIARELGVCLWPALRHFYLSTEAERMLLLAHNDL